MSEAVCQCLVHVCCNCIICVFVVVFVFVFVIVFVFIFISWLLYRGVIEPVYLTSHVSEAVCQCPEFHVFVLYYLCIYNCVLSVYL